jgi:hypothetical protein
LGSQYFEGLEEPGKSTQFMTRNEFFVKITWFSVWTIDCVNQFVNMVLFGEFPVLLFLGDRRINVGE